MNISSREGIVQLLKDFQDGYHRKDIAAIPQFVEKLFVADEPVYYGTSGVEQFIGRENIGHLIELDWRYWGVLTINFDQLMIHCSDDYGDFITTAVLVWDVPQKDRLQRWYGDMTGCAFSPEGEGDVQTARKVLMKTAQYFSELAEGEQHHYQLRISGAARKVDGCWKITSMHMSEPNL